MEPWEPPLDPPLRIHIIADLTKAKLNLHPLFHHKKGLVYHKAS